MGAKKVGVGYGPVGALVAAGGVSGVVVDVGFTAVRVTPIRQGVPLPALAQRHRSVGAVFLDQDGSGEAGGGRKEETRSFAREMRLPDGNGVRAPCPLTKGACRLLYSSTVSVPDSFQHAYQRFNIEYPGSPHWTGFGGGAAVSGVHDALAGALAGSLVLDEPVQLPLQNPRYAPLEGATILTQLNTFKAMCIGVETYAEDGPERCVHLKILDPR
ncbi:unnamed protein product [Phytomonas sp. EM1]|nr:unnamed protein product [Phytomonas sp. EM1]|eukprot:CCW59758.1 unnamed protein product [Phytomonas sp. isolate EM1]